VRRRAISRSEAATCTVMSQSCAGSLAFTASNWFCRASGSWGTATPPATATQPFRDPPCWRQLGVLRGALVGGIKRADARCAVGGKEVLLEGGRHDPREDEKLVCEPIRLTEGKAIGSNVVAYSCTVERDGIPDHRSIGCRPRPVSGV
jgi:hypothetical protein